MSELYLTTGSFLLLLIMYDFFYTTLSGSGTGIISGIIYLVSHKLIKWCFAVAGRRVYRLSGMLVNLMLLSVWVSTVWLGLFLIFSSDPGAITNEAGRPAGTVERLYFTGYTLSTLGMGNFNPTTPFFELLTSIFSFFGFIFFTTTMTYLISVTSAVIHKRSVALFIHNLGQTPEEMLNSLLDKDTAYCHQLFVTLQQMIDRHSVNHQAYPVLHYYGNSDPTSSFGLNLPLLDEAVSLLIRNQRAGELHAEVQPLRCSITRFLKHMEKKYSRTIYRGQDVEDNLPAEGEIPHRAFPEDGSLTARRKILGGLLRSESFGWQDVYSH